MSNPLLSVLGLLWPNPPAWLANGLRLEQLYLKGETLGLSRQEVDEVFDAWNRYYQQTPWPFDWDQASKAITHRSLGLRWEPPTGRRGR